MYWYCITGLGDHVLQFTVAKLIMSHTSDHPADFLVFHYTLDLQNEI